MGSIGAMNHQREDYIAEADDRLSKEWGPAKDGMLREITTLQDRLGVREAFDAAGLNLNPDLLIALGRLASDLKETSTIDSVISSTPVGMESEITDVETQIMGFMKEGKTPPAHLTKRRNDLYAKAYN